LSSQDEPADFLDALTLISSGKVTVTVGGYPFLSIRSDDKELDVDLSGVKRARVSLSNIIKLEAGNEGILRTSERMARKLSGLEWRLTLYDTGKQIFMMGRGVSRLTGHIKVNPLGLKRLLEAFR